ncbi:MAG: Crp/Fnr family transcriptional regulator [Proteobacteria bacterium]|nr:Crp/Fnr family transcriptional regulator [Pseudomonadota bacterium]
MQRNEHTFPKNSFLGDMSQENWDILSKLWTTKHYKAGQFLISADDDNSDVYFILRGAARITIYTSSGREVTLVSILAGDSFGEFSAIDSEPRSSSVVASGECYAGVLTAKKFREFLKAHPDISFELLKILIAHLRQLNKRVIDFNTKSADLRLQESLLWHAEQHCHGGDSALIERPPTQSELAAYIFSSREGVAREMGRLRKAGIIARIKRSLHIPSIEKLRKLIADNQ